MIDRHACLRTSVSFTGGYEYFSTSDLWNASSRQDFRGWGTRDIRIVSSLSSYDQCLMGLVSMNRDRGHRVVGRSLIVTLPAPSRNHVRPFVVFYGLRRLSECHRGRSHRGVGRLSTLMQTADHPCHSTSGRDRSLISSILLLSKPCQYPEIVCANIPCILAR